MRDRIDGGGWASSAEVSGAEDAPALPMSNAPGTTRTVMDRHGVEGACQMGPALTEPDRIGSLAVAAARADDPPPLVQSRDDRVAAIEAGGIGAIREGTPERWPTPDFTAARPAPVAKSREGFSEMAAEGHAGCAAAAIETLDHLPDLGRQPSALHIAGAEDMGASPAAMEAMAAAAPGSTHRRIKGAAHIVNIDAADAFDDPVGNYPRN